LALELEGSAELSNQRINETQTEALGVPGVHVWGKGPSAVFGNQNELVGITRELEREDPLSGVGESVTNGIRGELVDQQSEGHGSRGRNGSRFHPRADL